MSRVRERRYVGSDRIEGISQSKLSRHLGFVCVFLRCPESFPSEVVEVTVIRDRELVVIMPEHNRIALAGFLNYRRGTIILRKIPWLIVDSPTNKTTATRKFYQALSLSSKSTQQVQHNNVSLMDSSFNRGVDPSIKRSHRASSTTSR